MPMNMLHKKFQFDPASISSDLPELSEALAKILNQAFQETLEEVEAFISADKGISADSAPMLCLFAGDQFLTEIDFTSIIMDSAEKFRNPDILASCLETLAQKVRTECLVLRG